MMIKRLISLVIVIIITGFVASFLNAQEGATVIEWMGWRIEARTSLIVALAIGLMIIVVGFDRFVGMIIGLPERISGRVNERRQNQGHHALALGLVAVSAGDGREASRQASKAKRLLGNNTLTDLLSAQAAGLAGDHAAAATFFETLSAQRETAFFGQAGLMRLYVEDGRKDDALEAGREAFRLNKNAPQLAKALFALEAQEENWDDAITALQVARRDHEMSQEDADHLTAVLHYKKAEQMMAADAMPKEVLKVLEEALKADAGFSPAVMAARPLYHDLNKPRKVSAMLERAISTTPQPELVMALFEEWTNGKNTGADALVKLIRLIDRNGNDHASLLAAARIAMQLELWGEALRLVNLIPEDQRNIAAWQILAELAEYPPEGKKGEWPDKQMALIKASEARPSQGWICTNCNTTHQHWHSRCSSCDSFATVKWQ